MKYDDERSQMIFNIWIKILCCLSFLIGGILAAIFFLSFLKYLTKWIYLIKL